MSGRPFSIGAISKQVCNYGKKRRQTTLDHLKQFNFHQHESQIQTNTAGNAFQFRNDKVDSKVSFSKQLTIKPK